MVNVAVVYHSGFGHTQALAESVATGARSAGNTVNVSLIPVAEAEARGEELDRADAIIFGSPTYMGGVSAEFAKFKDWSSKRWFVDAWKDKVASGFTSSAAWSGDKLATLNQLMTLAMQHGMVWVGLGLKPGNNHSKGSSADLNRVGSFLGAMAQANGDQGVEGIAASDFATMEALGKRVAEVARRHKAGTTQLAEAA
jgi:multimeric flavodoxin WrbA